MADFQSRKQANERALEMTRKGAWTQAHVSTAADGRISIQAIKARPLREGGGVWIEVVDDQEE